MRVGVAISTTGDEHRLPLLVQAVEMWDRALDSGDSLFVTVDGNEAAALRVLRHVQPFIGAVHQVGQPNDRFGTPRVGVAANKNTGLELLMDQTRCERLWLSDDDSWPLSPASLVTHYNLGLPHSMVCWGAHRRAEVRDGWSSWAWPRGSVLYAARTAVNEAGGMVEAFGTGGHEHVEWSRRMHQLGLTPDPYCSPTHYADKNYLGAGDFWHCEDMPKPGETLLDLRARRDGLTSIHRTAEDVRLSDRIMRTLDGRPRHVPYRAVANRRLSATMFTS